MSTGVIQRLVKDRGFGFIRSDGGHELFFHQSQLQDTAFDLLREGQNIVFKVDLGRKGLQAVNVRLTKEIAEKVN